ncbi:MAG: hydrogenase formation protein HypD [Archaeoglobaceae archaeon]|nr:hydrogenase formation protein HypD [Archaeoglobaceae archaeon]MDW8117543.1 hydrogenase formation protein HypD [Archaeoglobaceae archaeon]
MKEPTEDIKSPKPIEKIEKAFRNNESLAKTLVGYIVKFYEKLQKEWGDFKIMDFCGTHEWTITHYGLRSLMPEGLELVAGPGCPVCVTPSYYIENAIRLGFEGIVVYTYGDVFRLPSLKAVNGANSLAEAKALGAEIKIVTGIGDAISDAKSHGKESFFLGIGFETVASGYAKTLISELLPDNLKLMSLVKLTPPAMLATVEILSREEERSVKGIVAPGHVSTIIGAKAWRGVVERHQIPVVVTGFEPIDVLIAIAEILKQLLKKEAKVSIEYTRAVSWDGDLKAQEMISKAFRVTEDGWRGIGILPESGLKVAKSYRKFDAFERYGIPELTSKELENDLPKGCKCAEIVIGKEKPTNCPFFMKKCKPSSPIGPCMVSLEGTCAIWARFGAGGLADQIAEDLKLR